MNLIFWLDTPPVCCRGVFDKVSEKWSGETYYICMHNIGGVRQKITEQEETYGKAHLILLNQQKNPAEFINQFLQEHKEDIHIFNGYKSASSVYLDQLLAFYPQAKTIVWAERPCPKWKNQFPWKFYHAYYALKYKNKVSALLPLGEQGVEKYISYGWKKEKIFKFLYSPVMNENLPASNTSESEIIRFIFLGRFSAGPKGTDILLKAFPYLKPKNCQITLVGGYGDLKDETLRFIEQNAPITKFGGTWPIIKACDNLNNFDVCIVPSRYEGWNVTINEALMSGIGCIASDECVSQELIEYSGAGKIVKACNPKALAAAMDEVMEKPSLIQQWKQKASAYRVKISNDSNAAYFIEILNYLFVKNKQGVRPEVPWEI